MELPKYDQYESWFGGGPLATHYGMDQMDLAKQFQAEKLTQERQAVKKNELANLFDEQNNPLRLQNQETTNRKLGYEADSAGVKSRIDVATEGLQLDAKQKEFIQKAKQSDLDMMEIQGQQWAYSPDPKLRAQGEEILRMHKDFVKLRDTQKFTAGESAKERAHDFALEATRAKNAQALAAQRGSSGAGSASSSYQSTDKMRGYWLGKMEQARVTNNVAAYEEAAQMIDYITNIRASERPDPSVGKNTIEGGQITPVTPRQKPVAPPLPSPTPNGGQPATPAKAPATLADVQKSYPSVPPEKLREAYKRKFGVDLK